MVLRHVRVPRPAKTIPTQTLPSKGRASRNARALHGLYLPRLPAIEVATWRSGPRSCRRGV